MKQLNKVFTIYKMLMDERRVRMKKMIVLLAFVLCTLPILCYSQATTNKEEIVLTTYYPVPYGDYEELRVKHLAVGENYYSPAYACWDGTIGCSYAISDAADLVVEGNVGIGTVTPDEKLTVQGNIHGTGDLKIDGRIWTNDVYLQSVNRWASETPDSGTLCGQASHFDWGCVPSSYCKGHNPCASCPQGYTRAHGGGMKVFTWNGDIWCVKN